MHPLPWRLFVFKRVCFIVFTSPFVKIVFTPFRCPPVIILSHFKANFSLVRGPVAKIRASQFFDSSITLKAIWEEVEYNVTVVSQHGTVSAEIFTSNGDFISEQHLRSGDVFTVLTTNKVEFRATANTGYLFSSWTSADLSIDQTSDLLELDGFVRDMTIIANYECRDNNVTIISANTNRGYVVAMDNTTESTGEFTIIAKTESEITCI